jgi:hypothetical protein
VDRQVHQGCGTKSGGEWAVKSASCRPLTSLGCPQDWHILRRRHTFALLATIYETSSDNALRKMILQVR